MVKVGLCIVMVFVLLVSRASAGDDTQDVPREWAKYVSGALYKWRRDRAVIVGKIMTIERAPAETGESSAAMIQVIALIAGTDEVLRKPDVVALYTHTCFQKGIDDMPPVGSIIIAAIHRPVDKYWRFEVSHSRIDHMPGDVGVVLLNDKAMEQIAEVKSLCNMALQPLEKKRVTELCKIKASILGQELKDPVRGADSITQWKKMIAYLEDLKMIDLIEDRKDPQQLAAPPIEALRR